MQHELRRREEGARGPLVELDTPQRRLWALFQQPEMAAGWFHVAWGDGAGEALVMRSAEAEGGAPIAPDATLTLRWTRRRVEFVSVPRRFFMTLRTVLCRIPGWRRCGYICERRRTWATLEEFERCIWPGLKAGISIVFQHLWWWRATVQAFPAAATELAETYSDRHRTGTVRMTIDQHDDDAAAAGGVIRMVYECHRRDDGDNRDLWVYWPEEEELSDEACGALTAWVLLANGDEDLRANVAARGARGGHFETFLMYGHADVERAIRLVRRMRDALRLRAEGHI